MFFLVLLKVTLLKGPSREIFVILGLAEKPILGTFFFRILNQIPDDKLTPNGLSRPLFFHRLETIYDLPDQNSSSYLAIWL